MHRMGRDFKHLSFWRLKHIALIARKGRNLESRGTFKTNNILFQGEVFLCKHISSEAVGRREEDSLLGRLLFRVGCVCRFGTDHS